MKKNLLAFTLIGTMLFTSTTAFAADDFSVNSEPITFSTNEYDIIQDLKMSTNSELSTIGYSSEEIAEIRDFSFENALVERGKLSDEELYILGYTPEQIELLRNYDGGPLENHPEMRRAYASLDGNIYTLTTSKYEIGAKYEWEWSNAPVLSGYIFDEMISCGYAGTNSQNLPCRVTFDKSKSSCTVKYYSGTSLSRTEKVPIDIENIHRNVSVLYPIRDVPSGTDASKAPWAKKGVMNIYIHEEVQNNNMVSCTFGFVYAHSTISISGPSISVSADGPDISFTLSSGLDLMDASGVIIKSNGAMIPHDITVK